MSDTWIVGINPVETTLTKEPNRIREIYIEQNSRNPRIAEIAKDARKHHIPVKPLGNEKLEKLSGEWRHQGVIARFNPPPLRSEEDLPELLNQAGADALVLVLDGVTDPHNFGACLRSAAAAKVTAVVVPKDRSSGITPTVRRAASGGADMVPIVSAKNLARALRLLKEANVWLTGLDGTAEQDIYSMDFKGPVALVLGGEGEGMRRLTKETCDFVAKIPMPGGVESLNVSVATGIVLFEVLRQRGVNG